MYTNRRRPSQATLQVRSSGTDTTYRWVRGSDFRPVCISNNPTQGNLAQLGLRQCPHQTSVLATFKNNCEQLHPMVCHNWKSAQSTGYRGGTIPTPLGRSFTNHTAKPLYELLGVGLTSYGTAKPDSKSQQTIWFFLSFKPLRSVSVLTLQHRMILFACVVRWAITTGDYLAPRWKKALSVFPKDPATRYRIGSRTKFRNLSITSPALYNVRI